MAARKEVIGTFAPQSCAAPFGTQLLGAGRGPRPPDASQLVGVMITSTRRFIARPEAVELDVIGSLKPRPE